MTLAVPKEREEAKVLVDYLRVYGYTFTAIPNENYKNGGFRGAMNKRIGVSPGFPDYLIVVNNRVIAIELKRQKGGAVSAAQKEWIKTLNEAGVETRVCKGFEAAKAFIEEVRHASKDNT